MGSKEVGALQRLGNVSNDELPRKGAVAKLREMVRNPVVANSTPIRRGEERLRLPARMSAMDEAGRSLPHP